MSLTDAEAQELAEAALPLWGGAEGPPRLVKNRENIVFEARLTGGRRVALRLHRPGYQSRAGIGSELWWAQALAGRGLPVAVPVPALSGALAEEAAGRTVSCVGWLEGAPIGSAEAPLAGDAEAQGALMRALGRLIAALHEATDAMALPEGFARPAWDEEGFLGAAPLWGRFWENPAFTEAERALVQETRAVARRMLADYRAEGADFGLIHADFLRENVLSRPEGLALIDFDDCGFGFRLYDLATALVQSLEEPHLPLLARSLIAGYREIRPLPDHAVRRLPLFIMLRSFASAGWIVSRAAPGDPRQRFYAGRAVRMARQVLAGAAPWD